MSIYEEMSTEDLEHCVNEMHSMIKENESYGSQIKLQNALFCQACAEAELEDRQIKQSDREVESFLEAQANMRDHEYELDMVREWDQQ
jgi:hypothetical protein